MCVAKFYIWNSHSSWMYPIKCKTNYISYITKLSQYQVSSVSEWCCLLFKLSIWSVTRRKTAGNFSPLFLVTFCPSSVAVYSFSTTGSAAWNQNLYQNIKIPLKYRVGKIVSAIFFNYVSLCQTYDVTTFEFYM